MAMVSPGSRYNAYAGTCGRCAGVGEALYAEAPDSLPQDLESTTGPTCEHECRGYRGQKQSVYGGLRTVPVEADRRALATGAGYDRRDYVSRRLVQSETSVDAPIVLDREL